MRIFNNSLSQQSPGCELSVFTSFVYMLYAILIIDIYLAANKPRILL